MQKTRSRVWLLSPLVLATLTAACSEADSAEAPADVTEATEAEAPMVPAGTGLTFSVDESVSTETHKVGDQFTATLMGDALADDGSVVFPAGTRGGWVVERAEADGGEGQAVLVVRLLGIEVPGGWQPVEATIIASDLEPGTGGSVARAPGAVALGDDADSLFDEAPGPEDEDGAGEAVEMPAGAVVSLASWEGPAILPADATVTLILDEAVRGPGS
jgi:hypothetical protein